MDTTRVLIIAGMGFVTYVVRALPQLYLGGSRFPAGFDRYLRYLAYALMASIIAISLFFAGARLEIYAVPTRGTALLAAVVAAYWSRNALVGWALGLILAASLPWLL
jgi:branched-subunit amino acid transport protein